jgi:DNA-binding Lrp family transcriptional regulator
MKAYVLIEIQPGQDARKIREEISKVKNVKSADLVTGPYDLVVVVEGEDLGSIGDTVLSSIRGIGGVVRTTTCVAV